MPEYQIRNPGTVDLPEDTLTVLVELAHARHPGPAELVDQVPGLRVSTLCECDLDVRQMDRCPDVRRCRRRVDVAGGHDRRVVLIGRDLDGRYDHGRDQQNQREQGNQKPSHENLLWRLSQWPPFLRGN